VPDADTAGAVARLRPEALPGEGEIVDAAGRVRGRHPGIHRFTVGQRRGLGVAGGERLYVTSLDAAANRVVIGGADALGARGARVERVAWVAGEPPRGALRADVRVRHRHAGAPATIEPQPDGGARIAFDVPVAAVAPGQSAVFYAGDYVLGGGPIAEALA
jgi:tRNA-specific 2-thiouridylase